MEGDAPTRRRSRPTLGSAGERPVPPPSRPAARRRFSGLTLRILVTNLLVLAMLVLGLFWLDFLRSSLINQKLGALQTEAEVIAAAIGAEGLTGPEEALTLDPEASRRLLARLVNPEAFRARLFDSAGGLIADSRYLAAASRRVQLRYLPPFRVLPGLDELLGRAYDAALALMPHGGGLEARVEPARPSAHQFPELASALGGQVDGAVRRRPGTELTISVAQPVQRLRRVQGALLLTTDGADIAVGIRRARVQLLQILAVALTFTVLLSLFLAGTIARPVRRLAQAAERVRRHRGRHAEIPDLGRRRDEIGDLSRALREMTEALYRRMEAIESFAADVAHEVRNPLASIRSALAALELTAEPARRLQLAAIVRNDLDRLDRLIGDISNASRVDAELSRADREPVNLGELLRTAVAIRQQREAGPGMRLELARTAGDVRVEGVPGRLGQVVDNLLSNAESFSPAGGTVRLTLAHDGDGILLGVEDEGPGVPEDEAERLFERFYTRRPEGEAFGRHSGLGLSIVRQIVEAHGGWVRAENRRRPDGSVAGARFLVWLPAAEP